MERLLKIDGAGDLEYTNRLSVGKPLLCWRSSDICTEDCAAFLAEEDNEGLNIFCQALPVLNGETQCLGSVPKRGK